MQRTAVLQANLSETYRESWGILYLTKNMIEMKSLYSCQQNSRSNSLENCILSFHHHHGHHFNNHKLTTHSKPLQLSPFACLIISISCSAPHVRIHSILAKKIEAWFDVFHFLKVKREPNAWMHIFIFRANCLHMFIHICYHNLRNIHTFVLP